MLAIALTARFVRTTGFCAVRSPRPRARSESEHPQSHSGKRDADRTVHRPAKRLFDIDGKRARRRTAAHRARHKPPAAAYRCRVSPEGTRADARPPRWRGSPLLSHRRSRHLSPRRSAGACRRQPRRRSSGGPHARAIPAVHLRARPLCRRARVVLRDSRCDRAARGWNNNCVHAQQASDSDDARAHQLLCRDEPRNPHAV